MAINLLLWYAPANAVTCPVLTNGDLFKVPKQPAVYLVNDRGERMYFPNSEVFFTWYADFKNVREISPLCVEDYPLGGGVNFRPGTFLVKTSYSNNVYAIEPGNIRRKITSAEIAAALYGADWEKSVRVIHENFMLNLTTGEPLTSSTPHNGQFVRASGSSTVYWVRHNSLTPVSEVPLAFQKEVRELSPTILKTRPIEPISPRPINDALYDAGQKSVTTDWQVRMYQKIYDILDFINGVGATQPPAVRSIAGQGDTLYTVYRDNKTGHADWRVKEGASLDELNRFLNAQGEYADRKPVSEAMFVDRDRLYVFYRGEDAKARWAFAPTAGLNAMTDLLNGTNGNTIPRIGTINGKNDKNPVIFYRQDLVGPGRWSWKKVTNNDMTDMRNFLNGLGAYTRSVSDIQMIHDGDHLYIFYR